MANISYNAAAGKGRYLDLIPGYYNGEINTYGPIYFELQAQLIRLLGLHAWLFRLPNLISGYLTIGLLAASLRVVRLPMRLVTLFSLLAILDVSFNRNIVSGRMDMIAVALVAAALFFSLSSAFDLRYSFVRWLFVGLLSSAAFLTTPRSLFLLPVVLLVALSRMLPCKSLHHLPLSLSNLLALVLGIALPISLWITSIGGPSAYLSIYTSSNAAMQHIGPSFFRSSYDNVVILIFLLLSVVNLRLLLSNPLLAGLFINCISFSLFVKEAGPYAAMLNPFLLMAILIYFDQGLPLKILRYACVLPLLFMGTLVLSVRAIDLAANSKCRDPRPLLKSLRAQEKILDQSLFQIMAPFKYYFLLESDRYSLITSEYSPFDVISLLEGSNVVVSDDAAKLVKPYLMHRFIAVPSRSCKASLIPPLTNKFAERSSFNENLYVKPGRSQPPGRLN